MPPSSTRKICLRPGRSSFPVDSFSLPLPAYSTSLYAESSVGASAETPTRVPPKPRLITLGSLDPDSPYAGLATFTNLGAALVRGDDVELLRLLLGNPDHAVDDSNQLGARKAYERGELELSREEIEEVIGAMLDADYLSRVREKPYKEAKADMTFYALNRDREEVKNALDGG